MAIALTALSAGSAQAARVSGTLVSYESQTPQPDRYLHFENEITHDIYMTPTANDGSFGSVLPPGTYALRAEHGAIFSSGIVVGSADLPLGRVSGIAPYAPSRLFDFQFIAPTLLSSAAPSTANILTHDHTPLPAHARAIPKAAIEWPGSFAPPSTAATARRVE